MDIDRVSFSTLRTAFWVVRGGAALICLFSFVVLVGHVTGTSALYRPIPGGPATHPITAIVIAWLGSGLLLVSPIRRVCGPARLLFLGAAGLTAARLVEMMVMPTGMSLLGDAFSGLAPAGDHGTTGVNTLVTAGLIAAGQLLRSKVPQAALLVAGLAPLAPLIAAFGYTFGFAQFHGEMSPVTVALLLPLSMMGLMSFVRRPTLRPLLAATPLAQGMRVELLAGLAFPWSLGAVLARQGTGAGSNLAIQSALMAAFAVAVVLIKTRAHVETEWQRQRTLRALQSAAVTDRLTGLYNRFGAAMRIEALPAGGASSLVLFDIDHFKKINDTWGHGAGDRVLTEVARVLRDNLGKNEIVARWGGEEFLVVLPGYAPGEAWHVAERLRDALRRLRGPGGALGEITASFGVAERQPDETALDEALHRADAALYRAKACGRDRVVLYGESGCSCDAAPDCALGRLRTGSTAAA